MDGTRPLTGPHPAGPGAGRLPRPPRGLHRSTTGAPDGPPLLLLHGIGSSSGYFRRLVPLLAPRWRVLQVDLAGHGRSPRAPRRPGSLLRVAPSLSEHADAVARVLAQEDALGAVVVGHSMGSQVAVELAARHPGAVSRLVLVTPTVDAGARSPSQQLGSMLRSLVREPPSLLPVQAAAVLAAGPLLYLRTVGPVLAHRVEDEVPALEVPVTVVHGQHDPLCSRGWAQHLADAARRGRVVSLPGCHVLQWSHPAELAAALDEPGEAGGGHR